MAANDSARILGHLKTSSALENLASIALADTDVPPPHPVIATTQITVVTTRAGRRKLMRYDFSAVRSKDGSAFVGA
jgi:UDP-N-acetylmuramyl pentapeptide synthase